MDNHKPLYRETVTINGLHFIQEMDLTTDTAFYRAMSGELLMEVDSSGGCFNAGGNQLGRFHLHWKDNTWYYEAETGEVIETSHKLLFDRAEPEVVAKLFPEQLARK